MTKIIVIVLVAVILIVGFVLFDSVSLNTERGGSHTGYVTAVDQDGVFFTNYQVYVKTDNSSSQEDIYCVNRSNKALIDELRTYSKSRALVTVNYSGNIGIGLGLCHIEEIRSVALR